MPEIGHYCLLLAQARLLTSVFLNAAYQHRQATGRLVCRLTSGSIICEKTHPRAAAAAVWFGLPSRTEYHREPQLSTGPGLRLPLNQRLRVSTRHRAKRFLLERSQAFNHCTAPLPSLGDGSPAEKRTWSGSCEKESHQEGPSITSLVTGRHTGRSVFHVSPLSFPGPRQLPLY